MTTSDGWAIPVVAGPLGPQDQPTADRYRWMVESVQEIIFEAAPTGDWTYLNPAWTRLLGFPVEECIGRNFLDFVHPDDRQGNLDVFLETVGGGKDHCRFEARYLTVTGEERNLEIRAWIFRDPDGTPLGSTGTLMDVTDRRRAESELEHRATHDPLTGLPNRALLSEHLADAIVRCEDRQEPLTLLFLDLDHFKLVNDGVGHDAGDDVLVLVATRLHRAARRDDFVARFGGDEFVVVSEGLDATGARQLAARVRAGIGAPMTVAGAELVATASVGIRVHTPGTGTVDDVAAQAKALLRDADSAMYEAKESGRDRAATFDLRTRHRILDRLETESLLRRGLERDELELHVQPQISVRSGDVIGVEALLRWNHPLRGMVGPNTFIPTAEECGLIVPVGRWVLDHACALVGPGGILAGQRIAVNVSPHQLSRGLVSDVAGALANTGTDPSLLCLELTESALLADVDTGRAVMVALTDLGVRLSLDDFGTGFSSLAVLQRLPLAEVKIDRSFIARLTTAEGHAVVAAIIGMADALGLETVAEGVEQAVEAELVGALGCTVVQGYHYSAPVPPVELHAVVSRLGSRM